MPLLGVNQYLTILHMSKTTVHGYSTDESINQFEIGYIVNPIHRTSYKMLKCKMQLKLLNILKEE